MNIRWYSLALVVAALVVMTFISTGKALAEARSVYHGGDYIGSIVVEPGQIVDGDLDIAFGDAVVEGTVNGNVNVAFGNIYERNGGTIAGQAHAFGGEVAEDVVPWEASPAYADRGYGPDYRLWWRVAWDVVVLVCFLIFPVRARMAVDRLENHPGLATAAGLFGWVAVIPLAVLLAVTIILLPLVLVEAVLLTAGVFVGTAALALLIGRRFYELLQPQATPSPLVALILGLALVTAAELVPVVGVVVTLLVWLVGLGASILTFIPTTSVGGPGTPAGRSGISGPPMPVG
jgi:hypothetical protein